MKNAPTPSGDERDRDARVTPSDIADAKKTAAARSIAIGRAMLDAVEDDDGADGPVPDEA